MDGRHVIVELNEDQQQWVRHRAQEAERNYDPHGGWYQTGIQLDGAWDVGFSGECSVMLAMRIRAVSYRPVPGVGYTDLVTRQELVEVKTRDQYYEIDHLLIANQRQLEHRRESTIYVGAAMLVNYSRVLIYGWVTRAEIELALLRKLRDDQPPVRAIQERDTHDLDELWELLE